MGTTVSIDVREPLVEPAAVDAVVAWFHDVDARFSPFRPDSEVSRVGSGELALEDASPDVRAMFTLADELRARPAATSTHAATVPTAVRTRPAS